MLRFLVGVSLLVSSWGIAQDTCKVTVLRMFYDGLGESPLDLDLQATNGLTRIVKNILHNVQKDDARSSVIETAKKEIAAAAGVSVEQIDLYDAGDNGVIFLSFKNGENYTFDNHSNEFSTPTVENPLLDLISAPSLLKRHASNVKYSREKFQRTLQEQLTCAKDELNQWDPFDPENVLKDSVSKVEVDWTASVVVIFFMDARATLRIPFRIE